MMIAITKKNKRAVQTIGKLFVQKNETGTHQSRYAVLTTEPEIEPSICLIPVKN